MTMVGVETDISVIIVNWNTRDILLECLESVERCRTHFRTETIVVDNGSEDGSTEAVRESFPGVKLIANGTNLGFARANNIGMKEAFGRYICLINSDVKVREGCLDALIRYMDANPSVGMVGPKILNPNHTVQDSCRRFPSLWSKFVLAVGLHKLFPHSSVFYGEHMSHFAHDEIREVDYLAGCFMFVRRKAIDEIGTMDERYFIYQEEVDWCRRLWESGWKVTFFPEAEAVHHHGVSSSRDPIRFSLEQQRAVLQYWAKFHTRLAVLCLTLILALHHVVRLLMGHLLFPFRPEWREDIKEKIRKNKACLMALSRHTAASHNV